MFYSNKFQAKYKVLDEAGWINWARRQIEDSLGPKGVSKYLLFWAREMDSQFEGSTAEEIKDSAGHLKYVSYRINLQKSDNFVRVEMRVPSYMTLWGNGTCKGKPNSRK
mgnify:CR=1 FL=1